ncbi:MAG: hypothetical protein M0Z75_01000 [Nitrospiraceae bacterium]|nr:hypothetical protein [Nitrospiraceae bacterium]
MKMAGLGKKKIAVIVRQRTDEALRMALGLTLFDDRVDVYLTGAGPARTEQNRMNMEMLRAMGAGLFSLCEADEFTRVDEDAMPGLLLGYEVVIAY